MQILSKTWHLQLSGLLLLAIVASAQQQKPLTILSGKTAEIVCASESEEVVLHASTTAALPVVDILSCGERVTVVAKQAGWYRVRTQGFKEGYVKDIFFAKTSSPQPSAAQTADVAALEAQYKTCAKHHIPADKCTPEIYQQLKAKDEAPLDPTIASVLQAVKKYQAGLTNPASLVVRRAQILGYGDVCLDILAQNNVGGMSLSWVTYSSNGKWLGEEPCPERVENGQIVAAGTDVTEKVNQALKDGK